MGETPTPSRSDSSRGRRATDPRSIHPLVCTVRSFFFTAKVTWDNPRQCCPYRCVAMLLLGSQLLDNAGVDSPTVFFSSSKSKSPPFPLPFVTSMAPSSATSPKTISRWQEDGRPQTIKYFSQDTNLPLTMGLLVDTSRSQTSVLDAERNASRGFFDQMLVKEKGTSFSHSLRP